MCSDERSVAAGGAEDREMAAEWVNWTPSSGNIEEKLLLIASSFNCSVYKCGWGYGLTGNALCANAHHAKQK